jgi:multiple sugar transport system permease protein
MTMKRLTQILIYLFLVFLLVLSLSPFYLVLINSTYNSIDIVTKVKFLPGTMFLTNYHKLQELTNIWRGFANSVVVSVPFMLFSCYFGAFAGYGFAKFQFKGKNFFFFLVLASMMLPSQLSIIGFYSTSLKLGMLNTFWPLILPGIANAAAVFFLRGIIEQSVPDSLLEAARMEGCSEPTIFNKFVLPCIMPGVATIGIFNFVSSWNNYLGPLIILSDAKKFTMPILIATIKGIFLSNYGAMYVAIAISIFPVIVVYCFLSRYIINGLTIGAEK